MLLAAKAIRDEVQAALNPIPGGYYRVEDHNGDAVVPSWWLHADSSTPVGPSGLNEAELVSLDIWHKSVGDLEASLQAVSFLWMWREYLVSGFPGASYSRESVAIQHEAQGIHHATITLTAITWDGDYLKRA